MGDLGLAHIVRRPEAVGENAGTKRADKAVATLPRDIQRLKPAVRAFQELEELQGGVDVSEVRGVLRAGLGAEVVEALLAQVFGDVACEATPAGCNTLRRSKIETQRRCRIDVA